MSTCNIIRSFFGNSQFLSPFGLQLPRSKILAQADNKSPLMTRKRLGVASARLQELPSDSTTPSASGRAGARLRILYLLIFPVL